MTFYKNGDRYFKGVRIQLTPQRYLNFSHLLSDLTKWISLPYGVRRLYSCEVNLHDICGYFVMSFCLYVAAVIFRRHFLLSHFRLLLSFYSLFQEGRLVETFDAMIDGEVYICASFEKFKPLQYGHGLGAPTFKGGRLNNYKRVTWSSVPFAS